MDIINISVMAGTDIIKVVVEDNIENISVFVSDVIGGSGSGAMLNTDHTPATGLNTFYVPAINGYTVIAATRSGLAKGITDTTPVNDKFLKIVAGQVTMQVGDITEENELFTFIYF